MKAQGLARIGRDVEIRYTPSGEPVANIALAFTYGKRDSEGKRQTQWVEGSLWGKRAESIAPYLAKGSQVVAYLDDIHIETYQGKNGEGHKLAAKLADIELVSAPKESQPQAKYPAPTPKPAPSTGFDDMDSDIPF
jgi:single-strand DNA-binding protein